MTIFFQTFGCKVNQCETNAIRALFVQAGFTPAPLPEGADVILLNSCTVTAQSDGKVRTALRHYRRTCPGALLVLTGCYPQAHPDAAAQCPEADLITGTKDRAALVSLVTQALTGGCEHAPAISPYAAADDFEALPCTENEARTRAFLKIQDGCNQFCTYCIIPFARGRCRSKPLEQLRQDAAALAASGHKEIVLVGINLAFYGCELGLRLADAVEVCAHTPGILRVRLGSLEPEQLTDEDLSRFAACGAFCPQFHLSLQSGCDRTLRAMNRHYTAAEYAALAARIRAHFPDCAITTDMMVGFPGETAADLEASMAFAREIGFAAMHVFPYSPREGTKAAVMPDQIPEAEKAQRAARMTQVAKELQAAFLESQVGRTVPVLFERERDPAFHQGHAPNSVLVKIPAKKGEKSLRKEIFCVTINRSESGCCVGTLVVPE